MSNLVIKGATTTYRENFTKREARPFILPYGDDIIITFTRGEWAVYDNYKQLTGRIDADCVAKAYKAALTLYLRTETDFYRRFHFYLRQQIETHRELLLKEEQIAVNENFYNRDPTNNFYSQQKILHPPRIRPSLRNSFNPCADLQTSHL